MRNTSGKVLNIKQTITGFIFFMDLYLLVPTGTPRNKGT